MKGTRCTTGVPSVLGTGITCLLVWLPRQGLGFSSGGVCGHPVCKPECVGFDFLKVGVPYNDTLGLQGPFWGAYWKHTPKRSSCIPVSKP